MSSESNGMEISQETIRALLDAFEQSDWREMTVTIGSDRLHVSRDAVASAHASAPPPPPNVSPPWQAPGASVSEPVERLGAETLEPPVVTPPVPSGIVVESPSVGLFWRAPSPAAPPFIEVGGAVSTGDTLAIVEVMKLMNHVVAPVGGTVKAILPANGEAVEYGQILVVIDPEG
jgi:acetyl-CoA carboxylase biotin carboxyl carrier protein